MQSHDLIHFVLMQMRNLGLLSQKLDIYKDWVSEAYQQIGTCQLTSNKDDLGRELRRLQVKTNFVSPLCQAA